MRLSKKYLLAMLVIVANVAHALAGNIKGCIIDALSLEPLVGAKVMIDKTTTGSVADIDGNYQISVAPGSYTLHITYMGYKSLTIENVNVDKEDVVLNIEMHEDLQNLGQVIVVGKKDLENERTLQSERMNKNSAVEYVGAKELNTKGIGNVQEGVKIVTGVSIANSGQLIVRGLGDRYSSTTLNGLPIASPNPDNKLVPLDLFPTNMVQNISVSKVYEANEYADYSGAHIDISTKDRVNEDFLHLKLSAGGKVNTLFSNGYAMSRDKSLLFNPTMDQKALAMSLADYDKYVTKTDIFHTDFEVNLNLHTSWEINNRFDLSLKATDLLNRDMVFVQEVPSANTQVEVEITTKTTRESCVMYE